MLISFEYRGTWDGTEYTSVVAANSSLYFTIDPPYIYGRLYAGGDVEECKDGYHVAKIY